MGPTNVRDLRSFLLSGSFNGGFVPDFALISSPHNMKLPNGQQKNLERFISEEKNALQKHKERVLKTLVLDLSRWTGSFTVDDSAFYKQVYCVLFLEQLEWLNSTRGYGYRILGTVEHYYDTKYLELFAVSWTVLLLWPYLEGRMIPVRKEKESINWVVQISDCTGSLS